MKGGLGPSCFGFKPFGPPPEGLKKNKEEAGLQKNIRAKS